MRAGADSAPPARRGKHADDCRAYRWTRVPTDIVRPLGAFTVVVQPPKNASVKTAATVERRIVRMPLIRTRAAG